MSFKPKTLIPFAELSTVLYSAGSYSALHLLLPHILNLIINRTHKSPLKKEDYLHISSKSIGALHSSLSSSLAIRLIRSPTWRHQDLIETPSREGDRIVALELGYLLSGSSYTCFTYIPLP